MQVLITRSEKRQPQPLTWKHHRLGLATSILLRSLQFKQGTWVSPRASQAPLTLAAQQTVYVREQWRDFLR